MELTPETASVVVSAITACGVIVAAWLANGARQASHRSAKAARQAADNAAPVSNGFAGMVRDNLEQILEVATEARDQATMANEKVDRHLEAHANAQLQAQPVLAPVRQVRQ